MSIAKLNFTLSDFEYHMACMRRYIKDDIDDEGYITSNQVKASYDHITQYAYIAGCDLDSDNRDCLVRCCFTEADIKDFYGCAESYAPDDEKVDWFEFFKQKHEDYLAKRHAELLTVKKAYEDYLQTDVVDQRGKKSKAHFCRISGYSIGKLNAALASN